MTSNRERILVVESDPDISGLIAEQALRPLGYEVEVLEEAGTAIERATARPPDLIITNLDLPDLGGKDVLAALSAQGVAAPVVVIAEKGEEKRAIQAFRLGAVDALLWPARDTEIVRVVERAIQPRRALRVRRQLFQQHELLRGQLKRRGRDLAAMLSVARAMSAGVNPEQLLDRVLASCLQMADGDVGWLVIREEKSGRYHLRAQRNLPAAWARKVNQPLDDGLSSLVRLSGQPLAIHGKAMRRFKAATLGSSAIVVPVKSRREVLGVLTVVRRSDVPVEKEAEALLEGMTGLISVMLLNSRLLQFVEDTAAMERRRSTARNELAAALESLSSQIAEFQKAIADLPKEQKEAYRKIETAISRLRRTAMADGGPTRLPGKSGDRNPQD